MPATVVEFGTHVIQIIDLRFWLVRKLYHRSLFLSYLFSHFFFVISCSIAAESAALISFFSTMPPKKRKVASSGAKSAPSAKTKQAPDMWLLTYKCENRWNPPEDVHMLLFSSREKAVAEMPTLVDKLSPWGKDWRNGLPGFGREREDDYLLFEYFGETRSGILLKNDNSENGISDCVEVSLHEMKVDPKVEEYEHDDDDVYIPFPMFEREDGNEDDSSF